jgi:hypothetical protein
MLDDPLCDWLDRFGVEHGFMRDNQLPGFDPRLDFSRYLFSRAAQFEAAVVACFRDRSEIVELPRPETRSHGPDLATVQATLEQMRVGAPLIYHGVVMDPVSQTFGEPDFLVRDDLLRALFPDAMVEGDAVVAAPAFDHGHHYRMVDVKFTTLRLSPSGVLLGEGSAAAYRAQVYVYTRALGVMQGYMPPRGYTLGRSWEQRSRTQVLRGISCMERLGAIDVSDHRLIREVEAASAWVRQLRREGHQWDVLPVPSLRDLWPNLAHSQDGPWHHAKLEIAEAIEDVTLLWAVGRRARAAAHWAGVTSWRDPRCTPALLGVQEPRRTTLAAMIEVNRDEAGPALLPARVRAAEEDWRPVPPLEFYVDFETVSDLSDDFSSMPARSGQAMIFLVGCGHVENGEWRFHSFIADALTPQAESVMLEAWFAHMAEVRARLSPEREPWVMHWSQAEESTLETAYNSAATRHPLRTWSRPRWFDFLSRVIRAEPVVVRGALGFGLKSIAQAMRIEGLIETAWPAAVSDGVSAAVGAWRCQEAALETGEPISTMPLMQEIAAYNEVDCKVMMEIVRHLRTAH